MTQIFDATSRDKCFHKQELQDLQEKNHEHDCTWNNKVFANLEQYPTPGLL